LSFWSLLSEHQIERGIVNYQAQGYAGMPAMTMLHCSHLALGGLIGFTSPLLQSP